jgi:cell wall-associated NlpC family hydrolase
MSYKTLMLPDNVDCLSPNERWQRQVKSRQNELQESYDTLPEWISDYIGLTFKERGRDRNGLDCWGLVRLVLTEQFDIDVPSYAADYYSVLNESHISHLIRTHLGFWHPVHPSQPGDCILFRIHKHPSHIGITVTENWMLHILNDDTVSLDRFDSLRWKRRIVGFYRHKDKMVYNNPNHSRFCI